MRDLAVLFFLVGAIVATLKRPWLGVLSLAVFSYMNPHAYAWGFMRVFPVYQVMFLVAFYAAITAKDRQPLPRDWRVPMFFLLWFYFLLTTYNSLVPWAAWPRLLEVSKIYAPFLLTLWLINSREKLFYLIITIAASFGILAAKGGLWAILTGFAFRVYGPDGTQFSDNNHFAIAVIMNIPLLVLWLRQTSYKWLRYGLMAAVFLSMTAAVSSWSRGALVTICVTGLVLIWHSKRKYLAIPVLIAAGYWTATQLPEGWYERMYTIQTYEEDASARSRITTWTDGFNYAIDHPFFGAGFEGWRYVTRSDWHSSYIEMMAEHGLIAFAMWMALLYGTILALTMLPRRSRGVPGMEWVADWSYMLRAALIAYATGTVFLGLAYWDIFYHLVFMSVLLKKFALEELAVRTGSNASGAPAPVYTAAHSLATQPKSSPDT